LPHTAASLSHLPATHEDPAAQPQSAQHDVRLSLAEHVPSPQRATDDGTQATHCSASHAALASAAVA
jgi:hypothetical protein